MSRPFIWLRYEGYQDTTRREGRQLGEAIDRRLFARYHAAQKGSTLYSILIPAKSCIARHASPVCCLAALALVFFAPFHAEALIAGAAKAEITPPLGAPLNGYGYRMGRGAVEVHDPLWARALYLEDDDTQVVLVGTDLCLINRELREAVVARLPDFLDPDHLILTATHNHSGTGGLSRNVVARGVTGPFRPDLLELTADGIVSAIQQAYDARNRAAIGYGTTEQRVLSKNRRHEEGPIDEQLGVIRVDDADGNAISIIANFAAHPTTIEDDFAYVISADYPGYFYDALEEMSNPGCVAIFLNGAEGNQMCGNPEDATGWAHTESIGRLLAMRTKSLANDVVGKEAEIDLRVARPELPKSLANPILPTETFLQTLTIDGLLMEFVPGEPCVEIGLELRRRARERGHNAQFTVGLANDHLMYFVPSEFYGHPHYEAGMHFYGPEMDAWLYREFAAMDPAAGDAEADAPPFEPGVEAIGSGRRVTLSGTAWELGYQRGLAFRDELRRLWQERVIAPVDRDELVPDKGLWTLLPGLIDHTRLALPRLAIGARRLLDGLDASAIDEVAGMAAAADLPFDALWLLQCNPEYLNGGRLDDLYQAPFCTMFAVTGDRAGADRILAGRNLDWPREEAPVVIEVYPDDAIPYVQAGFLWNAGVFTGMNEAGVVVAAERVETYGPPRFDTPPVEFVMRRVLRETRTIEDAQSMVAGYENLTGYHILLADRSGIAVVVELGSNPSVREAESGILVGVVPGSAAAQRESAARYTRVLEGLESERIVAVEEIQDLLRDGTATHSDRSRILNGDTAHSVVFVPRERVMYVAFPGAAGDPGEFQRIRLGEGSQ